MLARGVAGDHEALVLDRPGAQQEPPGLHPGRRPGRRHDEHLGAQVHLRPVELGEAQVVAGRQAHRQRVGRCGQVGDDEVAPGLHEPRLPAAEAEPVDLRVGRHHLALGVEHHRGVPQVATLGARLGGAFHDRPGMQHRAGAADRLPERGEGLRQVGPLQRLGALLPLGHGEASGAPQLRQDDEVVPRRVLADQVGDAGGPLGDALVGPLAVGQLDGGDPHGVLLRSVRADMAARRSL